MTLHTQAAKTALAIFTSLTVLSAGFAANGIAQETQVKITDSKLSSINYALESLAHWVTKLEKGDSARAAKLMVDHDKIVLRFNRLPSSGDAQFKYVSDQLTNLRKAIEERSKSTQSSNTTTQPLTARPPAQTPHRELAGIERRLRELEQDAERYGTENLKGRQRVKSDLTTLLAAVARIPVSNHPDYEAIKQRLENLQRSLQPSGDPLDMTDAEMHAFVNGMQRKYGEVVTLPQARDMLKNRELTAAEVDGFVSKIKIFSQHAGRDLPKLKLIVEATGQGGYWAEWIETKALKNLQVELANLETAITKSIEFGISNAKNRSELDIEKNNYAFNNEAMLKKNEELFARTQRTIEQAARLEQLLELPAAWSTKRAELASYIDTYRQKVAAAGMARELPVEVGTLEQHKISREVFKDKKYGVGKIVKQIVNSKIVPRERIEHKEFAGKLETIVRLWDEFQVTTVEQESGKYFVYVNNFAKFSRAPNPTPIGTWILTQRFKSGEIARDKVNPPQK